MRRWTPEEVKRERCVFSWWLPFEDELGGVDEGDVYCRFLCWNAVGDCPVAALNMAQNALSVA